MKCHITQFGQVLPSGISSLRYSLDGEYLSCAREDGTLEIYLTKNHALLHRLSISTKIHSCAFQCWSNNLLFVGGSTREVYGIDVITGEIRLTIPITGIITSLCFYKDLFVGTDKGVIEVYSVSQHDPNSLWLIRRLTHGKGKTLSIDSNEQHLFCGTSEGVVLGYIRKGKNYELVFTVHASGRPKENTYNQTRYLIPKPKKGGIMSSVSGVRAVKIIDNSTIVVGVQKGKIQFWDINTMTVVNEFKEHQSDVLCLAIGSVEDSKIVFASGVDHKVVMFNEVNGKWQCRGRIRKHTHTIRSLDVSKGELVSGGDDSIMMFYDMLNFQDVVRKIFPMSCDMAKAIVCSKSHMVVMQESNNCFKYYSLAVPNNIPNEGDYLLNVPHKCYFELTLKKSFQVLCFEVNDTGNIFVVGGNNQIRLFMMDTNQSPWKVTTKTLQVNGIVKGLKIIQNYLFIIMTNGDMYKYQITTNYDDIFITEQDHKNFGVLFSHSFDDMSVVALEYVLGNNSSTITAVCIDLLSMTKTTYPTLTDSKKTPRHIFKHNNNVYLDGLEDSVFSFSLPNYNINAWFSDFDKLNKKGLSKKPFIDHNLFFDPLIEDNFAVLSCETIGYVNTKSSGRGRVNSIPNTFEVGTTRNNDLMQHCSPFVSRRTGIVIGGGFLDNGDLVVITQQWLRILQSLPEPFRFYNKTKK